MKNQNPQTNHHPQPKKNKIKSTAVGLGKIIYYPTLFPLVKLGKHISKRRFKVLPNHTGITLDSKGKLFRGEAEFSEAESLMNMGMDPLTLFQENPRLFTRRGKVLGPRWLKYFKGYGTNVIKVDTSLKSIDLPPRQETVIFNGVPVSFDIDGRITYECHPIYFGLLNAGNILKNDPYWQEDFKDNLISEAYGKIHNHFQTYDFPDVCKRPIETSIAGKERESLLKKLGITAKINIESQRPSKGQEEFLMQILLSQYHSNHVGKGDADSFIKSIHQLQESFKNIQFSQNFLNLVSEFNKYKETTSRVPVYVAQNEKNSPLENSSVNETE